MSQSSNKTSLNEERRLNINTSHVSTGFCALPVCWEYVRMSVHSILFIPHSPHHLNKICRTVQKPTFSWRMWNVPDGFIMWLIESHYWPVQHTQIYIFYTYLPWNTHTKSIKPALNHIFFLTSRNTLSPLYVTHILKEFISERDSKLALFHHSCKFSNFSYFTF